MKRYFSYLAFMLAVAMLLSVFAACKKEEEENSNGTDQTDTEMSEPEDTTEESDTESETETKQKIELSGEHAELIALADGLKNGVVPYYADAYRQEVLIDNQVMSLGYRIDGDRKVVTHLSTPGGKNYIENTMDVFVELTDGKCFYASDSITGAALNIYRNGYYYYENRIEGQVFLGEILAEKSYVIDPTKPTSTCDIGSIKSEDGALSFRVQDVNDPWAAYNFDALSAKDYEYLEVTIKTENNSGNATQIFIIAGAQSNYSAGQRVDLNLKPDGAFHTYLIPLNSFEDYTGTIRGVRLDINGTKGSNVQIGGIRLLKLQKGDLPTSLSMQRSFLAYSDKLHQVVQLSTGETVSNVAGVGIVTEIKECVVEKLIVKDKNGLKESLEGVDWASCEYVGFDIKDAGIFGYILPCDDESGSIEVTLKNDVYRIVQKKAPADGKLIPSKKGTGNADDFYMGNRIYNDETHDFTAFLHAAECERHPLTEDHITVEKVDGARFMGYQPLYGYYKFFVSGTDFNQAYYNHPNKQFHVRFTVKGDDRDRQIYVSTYTSFGNLECAVLLDGKDMLLPVPIEVSKNFAGDGENTIYNLDDAPYGETFLPLLVRAGKSVSYSIVNLYQNWGIFPLKQISSIQYFKPYYHLSTGVTETNCIVPLVQSGPALTDHRAMSSPMWQNQPQHTQGGAHNFLSYTDYDGNYNVAENISAAIDSYGPTYCDITLGYQSADGKIKGEYTHTEMPQLDENRTYYEMNFTFLEDVSFRNFATDFFFYRVGSCNPTGVYKKVGYLDENNQSQVVSAVNGNGTVKYVLGDNCPYFSFFDMPDYTDNGTNIFGYVNVSGLIYNYEVMHEGEKMEVPLALVNYEEHLALSLDLKKIVFKAGDTITLNMILMPWGSEQTDYTSSEPDKNVRVARENTLLNPLKLTAEKNCQVIESVFVPKGRTTDGKSAEFTISGGNDNSTVRIYGFEKLTAPKIEEYVNGKWQEYVVYSYSNLDKQGNGYYYDGYMVQYDGDGTYSYSFVVKMDNGAPRKFRITADEDFKGWPEIEIQEEDENKPEQFTLFAGPESLAASLGEMFGAKLSEDKSYASAFGTGSADSCFTALTGDGSVTGHYVVMKYRYAAENKANPTSTEIFLSCTNGSPTGGDSFGPSVLADGKWHVVIFDMSKIKTGNGFLPNADGTYSLLYFRWDIFNHVAPDTDRIDIAYIGVGKELSEILSYASEKDEIAYLYTSSREVTAVSTKDGGQQDQSQSYVSPDSNYQESKLPYAACTDMINGMGGSAPYFTDVISTSESGVIAVDHNGGTIAGSKLVITGWAGVEGGIEKYVWSADGGKTWLDCENYNAGVRNSHDGILDAITEKIGYTFKDRAASMINGIYQGPVGTGADTNGIAADLSAFAGKTVNVTFAAVPKSAPDSLLVIVHIKNVEVK